MRSVRTALMAASTSLMWLWMWASSLTPSAGFGDGFSEHAECIITGDAAFLPEQSEGWDQGDADGRGGEFVVHLLDGAGNPHGQYLVAEVATRLQVDGFVFPRLCGQTLMFSSVMG